MPATFSSYRPGLTNITPSDTTVPGLAKRHVWTAPELQSHALLVLTLPRLYLLPAGFALKPEQVRTLQQTDDLEAELGPMAATIDLNRIDRVRLDLLGNRLLIDHRLPLKGHRRTVIAFAAPDAADALFSKLWRRLGADVTLRPWRADTGTLVRTPLLVMFALAGGTAAAAFTLNALADVLGGTDWLTGGRLPSWRAVCLAGGAAIALAQIWLYRRLTTPPDKLELIRS